MNEVGSNHLRLPTASEQKLQSARQSFLDGQPGSAVAGYQSLLREYPGHPTLTIELAQILIRLGQRSQALPLLAFLVDSYPASGTLMAMVGRTLEQIQSHELALKAYQVAMQSALPKDTEMQVRTSLAYFYERTNDVDLAQSHVDVLLREQPDRWATQFIAGLLRDHAGDAAAAAGHLRKSLTLQAPPIHRVRAMHTLARVMDRSGRFEEALDLLSEAKAIELSGQDQAKVTSEWVIDVTDRITRLWSDETANANVTPSANRRGKPKSGRNTIVLISGHPRSGTTLVEQLLVGHRRIASAGETSSLLNTAFAPLVGSPDRGRPSDEDLMTRKLGDDVVGDAIQRYRDALGKWIQSRESRNSPLNATGPKKDIWIDKNPESMLMLPMADRLASHGDGELIKAIVVLRDPRDVCLSCYFQFLPPNAVSVQFRTLRSTAQKYARTMAMWQAFQGKLSMECLVVRYEDLVAEPAKETERITDFLGVTFEPSMVDVQSKSDRPVVHSPTYFDVTQPIQSGAVGRWKNYRPQFNELETILGPFIDSLGYR